MKSVQLLLVTSVIAITSHAQMNEEPELTREQKWQIAKTEAFFQQKGEGAVSKAFLSNFKKVVASNILCKRKAAPTRALQLEGDRTSTETALLTWNVANEEGGNTYIIERRYNNRYGKFDSVGLLRGVSANAAVSRYHFVDHNSFPGKTWYRLRLQGSMEEKQLVSVEGYNNSVKVYPNPARSSLVQVQLNQFKTDGNTTLVVLDAMGRIVYTRNNAFLNDAKMLHLQDLRLAPGTYHIRVANKLNAGATSFLVQ